jgi:hypothetical protein
MARIDLTLRIILADPPSGAVFSTQGAKGQPVGPVTAGAGDLPFDIPITLTQTPDGLRPGGGFVRSDSRGRFVYIASGQQAGHMGASGGRRAKIYLNGLPVAEAGDILEAVIAGRARDGGPPAAAVPLLSSWRRIKS